jgi:hypothetical protein
MTELQTLDTTMLANVTGGAECNTDWWKVAGAGATGAVTGAVTGFATTPGDLRARGAGALKQGAVGAVTGAVGEYANQRMNCPG